jgi:hypothetical protein
LARQENGCRHDPWEILFSHLPLTKLSRRQTFATAVVGCTALVAVAALVFGQLGTPGTLALVAIFVLFAIHALQIGNRKA